MASLTQWTWVWVNSGNWRWTGRPGMLQSMGSRVRQDWATELTDWTTISLAPAPQLTLHFLTCTTVCKLIVNLHLFLGGEDFVSKSSVKFFAFSLVDSTCFHLFRSTPFALAPFCGAVSGICNAVRMFFHIVHSFLRLPDLLNCVFKICIH